MRVSPVNRNAKYLLYGIREVVEVAQDIKKLEPSFKIIWENIGDPVEKGWKVPDFVREILSELLVENEVFGYCHSSGVLEAREWVAQYSRFFSPSSTIGPDDIVFVNGLGAGINILYRMLPKGFRVLQPSPCYPAHSSTESFYSASKSLFYRLDYNNNWQPDVEHIKWQVKNNSKVGAILLINPGNPTGSVIEKCYLEEIVKIAEENKLMLISDEVYFRIVFNGVQYTHITELAHGRVPLVVLRGASKDIPWPGSRCGWLEFHNLELNEKFREYFENIKKPLRLEVCATTLPQMAIPKIYSHPEFEKWLKEYTKRLEENSNLICDILSKAEVLKVNRLKGAFYIMIVFKEGILSRKQKVDIASGKIAKFIEEITSSRRLPLDKRFVYYILASTGICVVPASDFSAFFDGFRVTALEYSEENLVQTYNTLVEAIRKYIAS